MRLAALLAIGTIGAVGDICAQAVPPPSPTEDSVSVVPGEMYEAGAFYQALVGHGHRDLWTTAIRVPVADMGTLGGGGLTPVELGGGTTTQTLHLRGADRMRYVFRSVNKTPTELLEDLEGTRAEAIIQDQMSSFHPSGALVVARLLEAVDVLHPDPELMVVPDDPRLGEFREQFAGMLVLFEERPDDLPEGEAGFAGSTRIIQTDDLFDELEEGPENQIQLQELLKARLVDLLVGDRDRSVNNHLWARFENGEGYLWRPIPRDRDQSFVQFDGFLKRIARRYDYRLVPFREEYANTEAVTRNAWDIDRNFLVGLDRETWEETVREVVAAITDEVIAEAVARMPPEHYVIAGPTLEAQLRQRITGLPRVANEFYRIVFEHADVHATDVDEVAILDAQDDGGLRLTLFRRGDSSEPSGSAYFDRVFSPDETRELRLYLHGGDDRILVRGNEISGITVRVVGGGGADELVKDSPGSVIFYDGGNQTVVEGGGVGRVDESPSRPFSWFEESFDLDWGGLTTPYPGLSYDSDRGLVPLVGIQHTSFGFARQPYASRFSLRGGWGFAHSKPIVESDLHLRGVLQGLDLRMEGMYSGLEVVNFFGLGNETTADSPEGFYEVDQEQLVLTARLSAGDGESWEAGLGPVFKRVVSDTLGPPSHLSETRPPGTGTVTQLGMAVDARADETDFSTFPTGGFRVSGGAEYYPAAGGLEDTFGLVHGEVSGYVSPAGGNPTLALRLGGRKLWGDFPFYQAAFLGGSETVRGLPEERFGGDGMIYGSAELRAFLLRLTFLLPADLGVFAFEDVGRVYLDGESSSEFHSSTGGGIWLGPLDRAALLRLSIASSDGRRRFYMGLGFAF